MLVLYVLIYAVIVFVIKKLFYNAPKTIRLGCKTHNRSQKCKKYKRLIVRILKADRNILVFQKHNFYIAKG